MPEQSVQFEEDLQRTRSRGGGVYSRHSIVNEELGTLRAARALAHRRHVDDEEADSVQDRDFKTKQVFGGWKLIFLAYQSVGIIYGDIGTSPLYVFSSALSADPTYNDLLGVLSLIIWSLTFMVTIKYVLIVLWADDEGEGGTFALFSLLSRYANIVRRDPRELQVTRIERAPNHKLRPTAQVVRRLIERSIATQYFLKGLGIFGVSLVMADGVLMPAQSVLGAIQGVAVIDKDIGNGPIVGISCAIIILLFTVQSFGTTKLASAFAPIVMLWLLFNAIFGIYNLANFDTSVLKAFSPYYAGSYLVRQGEDGWKSLGGVLLAFTGCEALFADLGAVSRAAVQLSWLGFAYPCLLLAYIGQAAFISTSPGDAWSNPFFKSVPPGMFWPSFILAILAAIVASQALITAVFQLLAQMMSLSYFPQVKIVHTSRVFYGQLYIPVANWLLMIGCIIVAATYHNTTRLGHAYGVCVILTAFISTQLVALVALIVWNVPVYIVGSVWLVFVAFEGAFLTSALTKVPDGAWFTLAISIVLSSTFLLWRYGKEQQWRAEASDRFPPSHILTADEITSKEIHNFRMTPPFGGHKITNIEGIGVFFDKSGAALTTPTVFIHFLQKFHAAPELIVFFHLRPLQQPSVPPEERYEVSRCYISTSDDDEYRMAMPNCYRVIIRHGYTDSVVTDDLGLLLYEQIRDFVIREGVDDRIIDMQGVDNSSASNAASGNSLPGSIHKDSNVVEIALERMRPAWEQVELAERLASLQRAYQEQIVYVVGKEQMRIKRDNNLVKQAVLWMFLWIRENSRSKVQALNVAIDKLVEVGFVKEV